MRLLFHLHKAAPIHGAGAEWMAHEIALGLRERGHEVQVYAADADPGVYELDGVRIHGRLSHAGTESLWQWCDLAVTHLDQTRAAVMLAGAHGRPLVHLVHNHRQLAYHGVTPASCALAVFNSRWLAEAVDWPGPSIVVRPPVDCDRYATTPGDRITLCNLTEAKGAHLFWALAKARPDLSFLAVKGAYGRQIIPDPVPANVEVIANTADPRGEIFARTRLLLMPSAYESWGRVAVEAACSGIPVLAHPTPGLLESMDGCATFADREDFGAWLTALDDLTTPGIEKMARRRMADCRYDSTAELDALSAALEVAVSDSAAARGPRIMAGPIDVYATERHYADHLAPIYLALPVDERGRWYAPAALHDHIRGLGVSPAMIGPGTPPRGYTVALVASHGDLRGIGDRPAVFVEHGAGQTYRSAPGEEPSHPAYSGGKDREGVVLFVCPSETVAERNRRRYPGVPAVAVGSPRMDRWLGVDRLAVVR